MTRDERADPMVAGEWGEAWPAPAKLNLFLHVIGRRADGYHRLQTVFCFVDLADTLRFEPRNDGSIVLATPTAGVAAADNLVVRAAQALRLEAEKAGAGGLPGVTLHLHKRIPLGGGLGGGSSDAATALLALNRLWRLGFSRQRLQAIGLSLGADVPVFIHGRNTFAEGVGERFTDVAVEPAWYLLTRPPVAIATAEIFSAPELRRDTPPLAPAAWRIGYGQNDLQTVAAARYPQVAEHLALLGRFGPARMTGSGSCCFVAFADADAARAAHSALSGMIDTYLLRGLARHPLHDLPG